MIWRFYHQVRHRVTAAHDTEALELGTWVNADHKGLVRWLLFVAELHVEETKFVPSGFGLPLFE
jgi:hypothetical protein